jgi:hypothetical protein
VASTFRLFLTGEQGGEPLPIRLREVEEDGSEGVEDGPVRVC